MKDNNEFKEKVKDLREEVREDINERRDELREEICEARDEIENEIHIKEKKKIVRGFFHTLLDLRDNMMSYEEIDIMMREQTVIHGANMWILMLAILIASIGLNMNSTAVIIGAMLVSPLMSGIMSMGYSVAVRDIPLLLNALKRFLTQVAICLVTSVIYFSITPLTVPTSEMIARTSPTTWDVLIAVFGGLAGMIGHTRTKHSNVIPGVAIATALMPPLCTAGYGIATGQLRFFLGAFYLFMINTLFIAISTSVVVLLLKVPYHKSVSFRAQHRVNFAIAAIATALVIPSAMIASVTVHDSYVKSNITHFLDTEFKFSNTQIVKSESDIHNKTISVSLVGSTLSSEMIQTLEERLGNYNLEGYVLEVTQNVFSEDDTNDKLQIVLYENKIEELEREAEDNEKIIGMLKDEIFEYENTLNSQTDYSETAEKAGRIFTKLSGCSAGVIHGSDGETVFMKAVSTEEISEEELDIIRKWLSAESGIEKAEVSIIYKAESVETEE